MNRGANVVDGGRFDRGQLLAWRAGMWLLAAVAAGNALAHLHAVCWALIASDNWNHIHPLLQDAAAGRLDLGNFLIQRAGVDHAQPLNKLVMWANARWFGLDFRLEGYLGIGFGVAALLVLYRIAGAGLAPAARPAAWWLSAAAIAAVFFSLNSSFIYTYSMVTMWYALYLGAFAMLLAAWHALAGGSMLPLLLATFALGIVADDSAYLDVAALALALSLYALRTRARRVLPVLAALAVALLASRGVYWAFGETAGTTQAMFNQPLAARLAALAAQWRDAWSWFAVPATHGLVDQHTLPALAGRHAGAAASAIAVLSLLAHLGFWWGALRLKPGATWLAALVLMLMFYAHVAAILLARVFVRGAGYLDQERYVSFYQFGIIALLLMAMAWVGEDRRAWVRRSVATLAIGLLLLQGAVSVVAYQREPGIAAHNRSMAVDMARALRDPRDPPATCASGIDLCVLPLERRLLLAGILREQRLSLYSPAFRRRHPDLAEAAGPLD